MVCHMLLARIHRLSQCNLQTMTMMISSILPQIPPTDTLWWWIRWYLVLLTFRVDMIILDVSYDTYNSQNRFPLNTIAASINRNVNYLRRFSFYLYRENAYVDLPPQDRRTVGRQRLISADWWITNSLPFEGERRWRKFEVAIYNH